MVKKQILSLMVALVMLCGCASPAYATELGDFFGGLKSIINADDSETYGVGEVAEQEGCTIKLTNVIEGQGNSLDTPQKGNVYLIFEFEIKNTSNEELTISSLMCFTAWVDDTSYTISLEALATGALSSKYQLDCVIDPGKSVTGIVGYEVPKDWKEAKIEFTKEAIFGEKTVFAVSQ